MDGYYVHFERDGRDSFQQTVCVPKELFDKLLPHADDLSRGDWAKAGPWIHQAFDLEDADLRPSEIDAIPDDHFIYVAIC